MKPNTPKHTPGSTITADKTGKTDKSATQNKPGQNAGKTAGDTNKWNTSINKIGQTPNKGHH